MRALRRALGGDLMLPPRARFAFYAGAAILLAATYAVSDDEGLQGLLVLILVLAVLPWLTHRFGRPDPYLAAARGRNPPAAITLPALIVFIVWGGVLVFVVPDLDLGLWFWVW